MASLGLIWETLDKMGPFRGSGTYIHTYIHLDIFPISRDPIGSNNESASEDTSNVHLKVACRMRGIEATGVKEISDAGIIGYLKVLFSC